MEFFQARRPLALFYLGSFSIPLTLSARGGKGREALAVFLTLRKQAKAVSASSSGAVHLGLQLVSAQTFLVSGLLTALCARLPACFELGQAVVSW